MIKLFFRHILVC